MFATSATRGQERTTENIVIKKHSEVIDKEKYSIVSQKKAIQ